MSVWSAGRITYLVAGGSFLLGTVLIQTSDKIVSIFARANFNAKNCSACVIYEYDLAGNDGIVPYNKREGTSRLGPFVLFISLIDILKF